MKQFKKVFLFVLLVQAVAVLSAAQPADHAVVSDSLATQRSTQSVVKSTKESDELILGEIEIKGKIDKPGVYVMPTRIEPELEEIELGRSFQSELRDGSRAVPKPESKLSEVDKIGSIKKAIERQRN